MQEVQNRQSYLLPANSPLVSSTRDKVNYPFTPITIPFVEISNTTRITGTVGGGSFVSYSDQSAIHIAAKAGISSSLLSSYILTQVGSQLAGMLVDVLDELEKHNKETISPIVSILEPYLKVNQSLNVNVQPKTLKGVNINVTRIGKVTPKIFLDESLT